MRLCITIIDTIIQNNYTNDAYYYVMQEEGPTYGSITTSDAFKRRAAHESMDFNVKNK
jgi:hypothetical protein